jgi:hypothetical protein
VGDWVVELHSSVEAWFMQLVEEDPKTADLIEEAIDMLAATGPTLGRPLVDRVKGSTYHNMKELRPASAGGTEIRVLFMFDPRREAILLAAGDKTGDWQGWYDRNIPLAEQRYTQHLVDIEGSERRAD